MRTVSAVIAVLLLAPAALPARVPTNTSDKLTAGRVAGAPRSCISRTRLSQHSHSFDDHALAYDGLGATVYVNHPDSCDALVSGRGIVSVTPSSQICRGDIIQVVEYQTGFNFGSCALGDFVPYSRPKSDPKRQ